MRQVFLKYLGSIHENAIHHVSARIKFWEKAKQILSTSALEPEVRQSIMNMIQKKVVKPGKSEIKEFNKLVSARRAAKLAQRNHRDDI